MMQERKKEISVMNDADRMLLEMMESRKPSRPESATGFVKGLKTCLAWAARKPT